MATRCKPPRRPRAPFRVTRRLYAWAVLGEAYLPRHPAQVQCLVAVMVGEGSLAHWNPMDTTLHQPGVVPYNSFGPAGAYHVWDYPDAESGVHATATTMLQGNMRPWVDALRKPDATPGECAAAFAQVEWAYKGDRVPADVIADWGSGRRSYLRDRAVTVDGPGSWPFQKRIR